MSRKLYLNGDNLTKCLRILNPYSEIKFDGVQQDDLIKKMQSYQGFQFNNLGCVHMKMEKFGLAVVYFWKAV